MQHRAVLAGVDFGPAEHGFDLGGQARLAGQVEEQRHRLAGDPVFGIIEEDLAEAQRKMLEALAVLGEELAHMSVGQGGLVLDQGLPGGRSG